MRTDKPADNGQAPMLQRYLNEGQGQLDVQGRLTLAAEAPSFDQKVAEMSKKLDDLDRALAAAGSSNHTMNQEPNNLPRRG